MFKYSINRKDKQNSTTKDEVEMVKTYLEIEKIRFEDRLQFVLDIDSSIENHKIPLSITHYYCKIAIDCTISLWSSTTTTASISFSLLTIRAWVSPLANETFVIYSFLGKLP